MWALLQSDWCPIRRGCLNTERGTPGAHRQTTVRTPREDGHLEAGKRGLRRGHTCTHLTLGLPAFQSWEKINFCCSSSPSKWSHLDTTGWGFKPESLCLEADRCEEQAVPKPQSQQGLGSEPPLRVKEWGGTRPIMQELGQRGSSDGFQRQGPSPCLGCEMLLASCCGGVRGWGLVCLKGLSRNCHGAECLKEEG